MVTTPGAGLHICFPDQTGERRAAAVLHGEICARCGARFEIEAAGGAATKAAVVLLYTAMADATLVRIGSGAAPVGQQPPAVTVPASKIKEWLARGIPPAPPEPKTREMQ